MDYKISVVIRTYNEEKHIGEVLKSLNKQTYSNFEVIILDSQSTDNTIKIAQNYDVRIEQIEKKEFQCILLFFNRFLDIPLLLIHIYSQEMK